MNKFKFKYLMNKCTRIGASIPSKAGIEVVRTETIKPLTPTPDHLKKFGTSITNNFAPNNYMQVVFLYPDSGELSVADRNRRLKESLSKTLSRFYPAAGRVDSEGAYVDCDDSGAEFVETKVNGCSLEDILKCPDNEVLRKLLPRDMNASRPDPLVRVQSNVFECGGMAIGTCVSHLVMDGCGRSALFKDWAAAARGDGELSPAPQDLGAIASRFPAIPNACFLDYPTPLQGVLRRFVFYSDKIASLRDRATSASGVRATRVEALTTFLYKCFVNSLTAKLGHETRPSIACQVINLRTRMEPPFSDTALGNMGSIVSVMSGDKNELVGDAPSIIAQFNERVKDLPRVFAKEVRDLTETLKTTGEMKKSWRGDIDMYIFSSLCGFGLYGTDFGWGKPVWISIADLVKFNNTVYFIEAREGGGIEAWITLSEEHMAFFETNTDLLEFASLNPPISLS